MVRNVLAWGREFSWDGAATNKHVSLGHQPQLKGDIQWIYTHSIRGIGIIYLLIHYKNQLINCR